MFSEQIDIEPEDILAWTQALVDISQEDKYLVEEEVVLDNEIKVIDYLP